EERLERGEVHDRRIGFDLAEVWIDRGVQSDVRRDADLEIPAPRELLMPLVPRYRHEPLHVLRHHVWGGFHAPLGAQPRKPGERAELRHDAALFRIPEWPAFAFSQ